MSYILDALKKSSEERRIHKAEQQETFPAMSAPHRNRKRGGIVIISLLASALIAAAVATGGWIFFSLSTEPVNTHERAAGNETNPPAAAEARITEQTPPSQSTAALPPPPASVSPPPPQAAGLQHFEPEPGRASRPAPLLEELPVRIQSAIPVMKFSGHVYSQTPSLRMIMINTDIYREKETVSADLRLIEITENGLIMEFRGTLFSVVLF